MAQIVSNTITRKLNMELKNANTGLNVNMDDIRVEDIESDSDSDNSSFDNDDFSDSKYKTRVYGYASIAGLKDIS